MSEVVSRDFEVDFGTERAKGFDLCGMQIERADQRGKGGFNTLSELTERFVPARIAGHIFTLGCDNALDPEIGFVTDNFGVAGSYQAWRRSSFVDVRSSEVPALEKSIHVDQGV